MGGRRVGVGVSRCSYIVATAKPDYRGWDARMMMDSPELWSAFPVRSQGKPPASNKRMEGYMCVISSVCIIRRVEFARVRQWHTIVRRIYHVYHVHVV